MLGDVAIAVHPDDERFKGLIGKNAILPLVGRRIPIVADEYSDPEKGTGAVKITPAHDFNDFEVGRRHGLRIVNIFGTGGASCDWRQTRLPRRAKARDDAGRGARGLDRFDARKRVVAMLEEPAFSRRSSPRPHGPARRPLRAW
jgi:valyl-tRNA synthetase